MAGDMFYCKKCNRTMDQTQFYKSHRLDKYPEGKLDQCKKCITMHVDNFDPNTYLWILQECDVPYILEEWNKLMATYGRDREKLTGATILGRYLAKMQLKQYRDYRWKDNEFLQQLQESKIEQTMKRQGYDIQDITIALERAKMEIPEGELVEPPAPKPTLEFEEDDYFGRISGAQDDFHDDLTDEDRTYLRLKWGKTYKPEEWIKLEQLYEEMMNSYDIQGEGHIDTLKLICKTSLKANQLIDMGDIEGYQKMSKVYNELMKSGKFTAAQNKAESGEFVDSIGELIEMCEKEGYIERFYVETPNDRVDMTIQDMQRYTRTLIEEETNLTLMVEKALRENAKEDETAEEFDEIIDEDNMSIEQLEKQIKDSDFMEFNDFLDEAAEEDKRLLEGDDE